MNLDRMLEQCRRGQWSVDDLDWSVEPRPMSPDEETAIVQYFTDMAGIELLAKGLFEYQRDHVEDETLRRIFETFVADEQRHADAALGLADHYNRHQYKRYRTNPHLVRFTGPFLEMLEHLTPEIANYYITTGEIFLDVALLRSINDFVDDEMSQQAMNRINRDESRHITIDFYMMERYTSEDYVARQRLAPKKSFAERARGMKAIATVMFHAKPFARDVFFGPIDLADPSGRRLRQAFKRVQLSGLKPQVRRRPFPHFMQTMQDVFNHPRSGPLVRTFTARVVGLDPRVITPLYTMEELREAEQMSFEDHAREVLRQKKLN